MLKVRRLGGGNEMDMDMKEMVVLRGKEMESQRKEYPLYESLEQFMQEQFEIKVRQRGKDMAGKENGKSRMGVVKSVN